MADQKKVTSLCNGDCDNCNMDTLQMLRNMAGVQKEIGIHLMGVLKTDPPAELAAIIEKGLLGVTVALASITRINELVNEALMRVTSRSSLDSLMDSEARGNS